MADSRRKLAIIAFQAVLATISGVLVACDGGWCIDGKKLDLGPSTQLAKQAAHDYDEDGALETNTLELTGLAEDGDTVTVQVESGTPQVYTIQGEDYRYADGTFA